MKELRASYIGRFNKLKLERVPGSRTLCVGSNCSVRHCAVCDPTSSKWFIINSQFPE